MSRTLSKSVNGRSRKPQGKENSRATRARSKISEPPPGVITAKRSSSAASSNTQTAKPKAQNSQLKTQYLIGQGFDSHRFAPQLDPTRPLRLGGVTFESERRLAGHSDGDVLLHAVCDALLGALGLGDIGQHFPPGDPRWRDADSQQFVRYALDLADRQRARVSNLDATLIMESPRLGPLRERLCRSLAKLLNTPPDRISIKAKTPEGLGLPDSAIAQVVLLLERAEP